MLTQLCGAPRPFYFGTIGAKICLCAVEEVFPSNAAAITHPSKDASLVVQIDWSIELCDVSRVHNQDSIVP